MLLTITEIIKVSTNKALSIRESLKLQACALAELLKTHHTGTSTKQARVHSFTPEPLQYLCQISMTLLNCESTGAGDPW